MIIQDIEELIKKYQEEKQLLADQITLSIAFNKILDKKKINMVELNDKMCELNRKIKQTNELIKREEIVKREKDKERKEDKKIMDRKLARVIVCLFDDKLKLPSMMLASLEENLVNGNFDRVYDYYSNRLLELERNKGEF